MSPASLPTIAWSALLPMLLVTGTGLLILVLDPFTRADKQDRLAYLSLGGVAAAAVAVLGQQSQVVFGGSLAVDAYGRFFNLLFLLVAALALLLSLPAVRRAGMDLGEYCALLLFSTLGMMIMAGGLDLMTIFLGLETLSISLYILVGFLTRDRRSNEAALKYLLLGAFASGFVLYGIALIYGATGTIQLRRVAEILAFGQALHPGLAAIGAGLLIIGLGFKVAVVPFHMWVPDVYEGAPTPVTAFMIAGTKAAAFAAFLRVLLVALPGLRPQWTPILSVLAVLTMCIGNLVAIWQTSLKRMLAYSSIAHAGYILVAVVAGGRAGTGAILFYLAAYAVMNLGAFGVALALAGKEGERTTIEEFAGLGLQRPALGAAMAIFMFSLIGIPPTGGFMGKLYLFSAAIQAGYVGLAVVAVLNSVVSAFYYLRLLVVMYMVPDRDQAAGLPVSPPLGLAILLAAVGTLVLGLIPSQVLAVAFQAAGLLLG